MQKDVGALSGASASQPKVTPKGNTSPKGNSTPRYTREEIKRARMEWFDKLPASEQARWTEEQKHEFLTNQHNPA